MTRKIGSRSTPVRAWPCAKLMAMLACSNLFAACAQNDQLPANYTLVNHTNVAVASLALNDRGGVISAPARGQSGDACCISIPTRWRPDLTIKVTWQEDSTPQRDGQGREILRDGKPVLVEGSQYTRSVAIQRYGEADMGRLIVHILEDRQVVVKVSMQAPFQPDYRPLNPTQGPRP